MFISRFWTLLLALAVGVVLAVVLLAKDVVNRERVENATAILYKEVTKADVALKLHARKRLDILLTVAVDPQVRKLLTATLAGGDKRETSRGELLGALRKLNTDLGEYKADLLVVLDGKGEVVCQAGRNEREHGYSLAGFPAVDAALRGFVRDDIWKLGNEVFLIAARPIIHEGRYVGAVVHAMKVTDELASRLSPSVQFALFSGKIMMAVGSPSDSEIAKAQGSLIATPLADVLKDESFKTRGYSDVLELKSQDSQFMAVYSQIRGEAAQNNVGFSLVVPLSQMASWTEFYDKASSQDIENLPIALIVIGVIFAALVGSVLIFVEGQRPLKKLLHAIQTLEKSDPKDQLNVYQFRRNFRAIATSINALVDFKLRSFLENKEFTSGPPKSIDSILSSQEGVRLSSNSFKFVEASPSEVPPAPPPSDPPEPVVPEAPPPKPLKKPEPSPSPAPAAPQRAPAAPPPGVSPAPAKTAGTAAGSEEEARYFKQIYGEFIKLKKSLGEPTDQLTFERFGKTLTKNRDTLKARYGCAKVRFQVYEKDGKASLKATPVK